MGYGYGYEEYSEMGFDDLSNDDDYDDYIDYDELSWDDYDKHDDWPVYDTSFLARVKRLLQRAKAWYWKVTGQLDDIPF